MYGLKEMLLKEEARLQKIVEKTRNQLKDVPEGLLKKNMMRRCCGWLREDCGRLDIWQESIRMMRLKKYFWENTKRAEN